MEMNHHMWTLYLRSSPLENFSSPKLNFRVGLEMQDRTRKERKIEYTSENKIIF